MDTSSGHQIYEARKAGALWSIACYIAGVALRDGLEAAREYADVNGFPWPPPMDRKKGRDFLGTPELRAAIGMVFVPRGKTPGTPTGKSMSEKKPCNRQRQAYQERLLTGDPWAEITLRLHYKTNYNSGNYALRGARTFAQEEGLPWPIPAKEDLPTEPNPCRAYFYRGTGIGWDAIAMLTGYTSHLEAWRAAKTWAEGCDLPWPI